MPNGMIIVLDEQFTMLYLAGDELKRFPARAALMGACFTRHFTDLKQASLRPWLSQTFAGEPLSFEARYEEALYQVRSVLLPEEAGKGRLVLLLLQNMTRQKQEEARLRLLESVITHTTDAVIISEAEPIDQPGPQIVYVNPAFTAMTGYEAAEVIGKNPRLLQGPGTNRLELDRLRAALNAWQPCTVELQNYKKDGTPFWISFTVVPVADATGWFTHWISVERDITALKQQQENLKRLNEDLSRQNKELQQFSYITSHNLRAPVANLMSIVGLVDPEPILDPTTAWLLETFRTVTYQLNDTLNDLVDILVLHKGSAPQQWLSLAAEWEQVSQSVSSSLDEVQPRISLDFRGGDRLYGNLVYVRSILLNLLTNALKYRADDRPLHISLLTEAQSDGLRLRFGDNGSGIDLDRYGARVFAPYQRFQDRPNSKGLGLFIVHSQVRAMGGQITVESEPGLGTAFVIDFVYPPD